MLKSRSFLSFVKSLEKIILRVLEHSEQYEKFRSELQSLYQPVMACSWENRIRIKGSFSNRDLLALIVLTWWMDPVPGWLIRMEVMNLFQTRVGSEDLALCCYSREVCLKFIYLSSRFNLRELGGIFSFKNLLEVIDSYRFCPIYSKTKPPKRQERHKGYRDKGTLPDISVTALRQGVSEDYLLRELQNEKENYQENIQNFLAMNLAWLLSIETSFIAKDYKFNSEKGVLIYEDGRILADEDRVQRKDLEGEGKKGNKPSERNQKSDSKDRESEVYSQLYLPGSRSSRKEEENDLRRNPEQLRRVIEVLFQIVTN